jgi:hypothetical protein
MPILAGSNDRDKILNHMRQYYPINFGTTEMTTATDEGLAWGFRLLSPNYSNIWGEEGENFPAPYNTETEKRLIIYPGMNSFGYAILRSVGTCYLINYHIIEKMCSAIHSRNIEVYVT